MGLSQVNAETAILAANLSVGNGHHGRTDTTVPAGDVISQNPAAGASVDEPARRWTWWCRWGRRKVATVPDVVGLSQAECGIGDHWPPA